MTRRLEPEEAPGRMWTWPIAIGLFSASGLISALVSEGWGDTWAWLALGVPVVVMAVCALRRRPASRP